MAIDFSTVSGVSPTQSTSEASLTGAAKALGKDSFLKLLVAQITHQDPLKPMDDTAYVAQLAQFSALEQAMSTNQKLDFLALQQQGMGNTDVANLVGRNVTVKGDKVRLDGQGLNAPMNFTLGDKAESVTVKIVDANGKTVRTMQMGPQNMGLVKLSWDGKDDNGLTQPIGTYTVSIDAKNSAGGPVEVLQESSGVLKSVSFINGYAQLELDSGVTATASDLLRVNDTPAP